MWRTGAGGVTGGAFGCQPCWMLAGFVDLDELDRWVRLGWERRRGSTVPYGLSDAS
jgi:hypothetical protein